MISKISFSSAPLHLNFLRHSIQCRNEDEYLKDCKEIVSKETLEIEEKETPKEFENR